MNKADPFYVGVVCEKIRGGKNTLWHAHKAGFDCCGAGNTADNAIKDLAEQIRARLTRLSR